MHLIRIPAFQDNYIWLLANHERLAIIVDPGEAQPVIDALSPNKLVPTAILLTHHHNDHTGGVMELVKQYPELKVYGPEETRVKGAQIIVKEGDEINLLGIAFNVIEVPGHTLGHVAYHSAPYLFCGDTLFSAGCGRIFEGTAKQMYQSLQKLAALPDSTKVCCAHEYTLSNLRFAHTISPENIEIKTYQKQIERLRSENQASVPTELRLERRINLFLRCHDVDLQRELDINEPTIEIWQVFERLRSMKDNY
ncbi:hydroxyacylglutathione hydrolase [Budvicia diplopodorum]|uniref:hydroxyacylglutathione hydrolase n=1 Tax=Budvicia diplopodorum TaxID=1119056 RepID=UPI00135B727C|nr:hydroxyacylglutathione hydrolase [Budvicia diplopodorum]